MSESSEVILYSYWRSSASWRVRLVLALKGIKYQYKAVNLVRGEQTNEEYTKVNPMKLIPSLVIDGNLFSSSVAIMEYLEETRTNVLLLPKDSIKRAKVRQIVETICGDIHPIQNLRVLKKIDSEKMTEWCQYWISTGFEGLEKILTSVSGKYCVGDEITLADCCLVPQVYNAVRWFVDMSKYPTIVRINEELSKLPQFKEAHADNQPDTVKTT